MYEFGRGDNERVKNLRHERWFVRTNLMRAWALKPVIWFQLILLVTFHSIYAVQLSELTGSWRKRTLA